MTRRTLSNQETSDWRRFVVGVRTLIDQAVKLDAPAATLADLADRVEALAASVAPYAGGAPIPKFAPSVDRESPGALLPFSPVSGCYNPLAPPVAMSIEDGRIVGKVTLGEAYEGPPRSVHGSVIASVYDQVLAFANIMNLKPGHTATLSIHFRHRTPLHEELRFEGWTDKVDGRKVWARGACFAGDRKVTEAEGLFILLEGFKQSDADAVDPRGA
jgi:acyl-coenzyme A thioesterase PaaI-like protein